MSLPAMRPIRTYLTISGGQGIGTVRPSVIGSPGVARVGALIRRPLTKVPFVEPRSSNMNPLGVSVNWQ